MKNNTVQSNIMRFVKAAVISLALIGVEFIIGFLVYRNAVSVAYSGIIDGYAESAKKISADLSKSISDNAAYDLSASLSDGNIEINGTSYVASDSVNRNILSSDFTVAALSDLIDNSSADDFIKNDKKTYAVYVEKTGDKSANLSLKNMDALTAGISLAGFNGLAVFSDSRRTVYVYDINRDDAGKKGIAASLSYKFDFSDGAATETTEIDGSTYAVALSKIDGTDFYAGGYADFSAKEKIMSDLKLRIVLLFAILGVAVIILVFASVFLLDKKINGSDAPYKIVTDGYGKILRSNKAFGWDFPDATLIKERVNRFDEKNQYAITVPQDGENKILTCHAEKKSDGTVSLSAEKLTVPFGTDVETEHEDTMRGVYETLAADKDVLVGEAFFENLHDVKVIFGRDFAEKVRNALVERIKEKFQYVFQMDYYHIGIIHPDGKTLKHVLRDLPDYVAYFNKVVSVNENLVKAVVKCGFAMSDNMMESRDYEYVMTAVNAALSRSRERTDDPLLKVDYYLYHESQKSVYSRYFFKIDIPKMLAENSFLLEYQPQYSLKDNKIVAFEALFRVRKSIAVKASTADIIAYAEQSGAMILLGDFIFNTGMQFAKSIEGSGVSVSLNVSLIQLMQAGFVDNFMKLYRKYDLKPGSIAIEITESYLIRTLDETVKKLEILRSNGIGIHLDDFGTAYSSFHYLQDLPITAIKVDQIFIKDILKNKHSQLISKTIIDIARSLDLQSICEGVETDGQFEYLKSINGDLIQGFLISRSVDAETARKMISDYRYVPKKKSEDE